MIGPFKTTEFQLPNFRDIVKLGTTLSIFQRNVRQKCSFSLQIYRSHTGLRPYTICNRSITMPQFGKYLSPTFGKFLVTGLGGVFVNLGSFQLMLTLGVHPLLASPIAIELSIISNFLLNNYWTFRDRSLSGRRRIRGLKYHIVSFVTLLLSYGTFVLLSVLFTDVPLIILQGCAIAPAGVLNYSANSLWTFREETREGRDDVRGGTG